MRHKIIAVTLLAASLLTGTVSAQVAAPTLVVRASSIMAGNIGPVIELRINGATVGKVQVRAATPTNYKFDASRLVPGAAVDLVFANAGSVNGQARTLLVSYLQDSTRTVLPTTNGVTFDRGVGPAAFDGLYVIPGQGELVNNGALRLKWPRPTTSVPPSADQQAASRLLQQATFGPTTGEIAKVVRVGQSAWLEQQLAMPWSARYVPAVQQRFDYGDAYRPGGFMYQSDWVGNAFWTAAATAPDQLRGRMAFALGQILTISFVESRLWAQSRGVAHFVDNLHKHAFGNYRNLLEEVALSPMMGIYLSHLRNRMEDPTTGRLPDENFAREIMQLFSIGLHELNPDGSTKVDANNRPIETYSTADVMAMAKVFTGWGWGFPDDQLTEKNLRWAWPSYSMAEDAKVDLQRMKAYPGQHSQAEKQLFAGKPWAVTIPAGTSASDSLRMALDALYKHPNVGPFIGRQLIQRLVTANPSRGYVARVTAAFNNNGKGVRGDLSAVLRAILLDPEARGQPTSGFGKLREPILRVSHWMRSFGATSATGLFTMADEGVEVSQQALYAPNVFGFFRPGYVPPNTRMSQSGATSPEFQIVNESTAAAWVNLVEEMVGIGLGATSNPRDVRSNYPVQTAMLALGKVDDFIQNLNLLLFAGNMSAGLQSGILEAIAGVTGNDAAANLNRVRVAVFIAMSSPEYLVQR